LYIIVCNVVMDMYVIYIYFMDKVGD
jgi:hypothetical protein